MKDLGGFDGRFFYQFEEVDLCYRVWKAGHKILSVPGSVITHIGSQSVGRYPIRFELEKYRNRYRYFYKHYGMKGVKSCQKASLAHLRVRKFGYKLLAMFKPSEALKNRLEMYKVAIQWNKMLDGQAFIEEGTEPQVGYEPLAPAPKMTTEVGAKSMAA